MCVCGSISNVVTHTFIIKPFLLTQGHVGANYVMSEQSWNFPDCLELIDRKYGVIHAPKPLQKVHP